jgi:DNA-directed RNA polymerase III subunit RPC1
MQVAKSIKLVMTSRLASLVVTLDMERIRDVQLCIDANIVKESIIQTPKLKLKQEVRIFQYCFFILILFMFLISQGRIILQHIKALDVGKLEIHSPETDRSKIHFQLHSLKNLLPTVVVKVKPSMVFIIYHLMKDYTIFFPI